MDSQQKYDILTRIVEISSSTAQINDRLTQAANFLCRMNLAPTVAFYLLQHRGRKLTLRLAADAAGGRQLPTPPGSYKLPQPEDRLCRPLTTLLPSPLKPESSGSDDLFRQEQPHGWSLPLADENQAYGTMVLLGSNPFSVDNETIRFLLVVCRQLTLALRSSILKNQDQQRVRRLKFLHQIGAQLNASADVQSVFARLPQSALAFFSESAAILHIFENEPDQNKTISQGFRSDEHYTSILPVSRYQAARIKASSPPQIIDRQNLPAATEIYQNFFQQFCAHIILPLSSQGRLVGCLEFFLADQPGSQELLPLAKEDLELLEILADHLAATLERTRAQNQLSMINQASLLRTQQLTLSHQMKNALLAADTPEKIIRLTLGALVSREGFTSSPALYLELQEKDDSWQGLYYASAPDGSLLNLELQPDNQLSTMTNHLLEASSRISQEIEEKLKNLKVPSLKQAPSRFQQAVIGKKPTTIPADFVTINHAHLKDLLPGRNLTVIPIMSQDQLQGLILANADQITLDDLAYITLFTDAAALALDNARLYQRLQSSLASLNSAQLRLAQSEKLMALGEMASSIAHEIKNPLVSIGGFARRLHKRIPEQSREKAYSHIITKEIERLEEIVNNVLSFSRPENNKFEPNNLNLLLNETAALFARELKRLKIKLQLRLCAELKEVECDGNQLKQVFINLFNNSMQAMTNKPSGTKHCISVRTSYYCDLQRKQERALIEIEDNGKGIQEQFIHDIFNPFFTTKHDGTGLGLPICHRIILNHQGDIRIHNREGKGVTVSISLPFRHKPTTTPAGQPNSEVSI
ncbi:MAG: hypothetical protein JXR80_08585 [Deltaproteobacteria bacterium]|nr:hypothetical protein [Deltaproteobacteria bacterium]